jgi:hypothetical protein
MRPQGLGKLKKKNHFNRSRYRAVPAGSTVPQPLRYHVASSVGVRAVHVPGASLLQTLERPFR